MYHQVANIKLIIFNIIYSIRYLEDLAMATGHMREIKLIEGLTVAAETLGGEIIFFSLSGNVKYFS